jgi:hypothetical protein
VHDDNKEQFSEADAAEVESILLREVYEAARTLLRFNGVDAARVSRAIGHMDMAVEQVKIFDGGLMDESDMHQLLYGRAVISKTYQICSAYESGYGHGLERDGLDNQQNDTFACVRCNEAYKIGYAKGVKLRQAQKSSPETVERERDRHSAICALAHAVLLSSLPVPAGKLKELDNLLGLSEFILKLPKETAEIYCQQAQAYGVAPVAVLQRVLLNASLNDVMVAAAQAADPAMLRLPALGTEGSHVAITA